MSPDVVVVGGGISGLAAAHRLDQSGMRVTLVEKTSRLGGVVSTGHDDGFLVEGGPDSFVTGKRSVLELAEELGLGNQVISTRPEHQGSYVWWEGKLHPLPGGLLLMVPSRLRPLFASSLLSWKGKIRALGDLVLPRSARDGDESLESFVSRRLGREVLERVAEPLIAGIHAAEPDTMSLRASFPRFIEMERQHRSLIVAARAAAGPTPPAGGLSHFASFRKGMGQLTATLTSALDGVDLRTGVGVAKLEIAASGGYRLELADGTELRTGAVILALPAPVVSELLADLAPGAASALGQIRRVSTAAVTLAYRARDLPPLPGSGFVVPSVQGRRIMGVSLLSQKWEGRVPDTRYTLIRVFARGQDRARSSDDHLYSVVGEELAAMLGLTATPVRSWLRVWEQGLHQYTLGHLERVAVAEGVLRSRPGLAPAGAGFHGIGLNECIDSGWRAADSVLGSAMSPVLAQRSGGGDND